MSLLSADSIGGIDVLLTVGATTIGGAAAAFASRFAARETQKQENEYRKLFQISVDKTGETKPVETTEEGQQGAPKQQVDKVRHLLQQITVGDARDRDLLTTYHAQGLSQSKTSFNASLVFAAIGFVIIVIAVGMAIFGNGLTPALLTGAAGVITEAVAALFFAQANKSRELMADFFDKLRNDQRETARLQLAVNLLDLFAEPKDRDVAISYMIKASMEWRQEPKQQSPTK